MSRSTGDPLARRQRADVSVSATREDHTKALGDLYRDHYRQMLRVLSARTGSRQAAEEILHEAYARMLELDRPDVSGFLANYVWKLVWNLLTDGKRREGRRARLDPVALFETEKVAPSPEATLCEQQRLEMLDRAMDKLRPKELEAFILRAQEGLSFKEIAARMGVSERMAQLHVASALKYCYKYMNASGATRRAPK